MNQKRQPSGIPTGGQFAENQHDAATSSLGFPPTAVSDLQPGDIVDMNESVSSYVDSSFDGIIDGEDDGQWMKGNHTVKEVRQNGSTTTVVLEDYEWHFANDASVPVVGQSEIPASPEISSFAGLASYQTPATLKTEQPVIGYSPDSSLVDVSAPSTGSGMTYEIGVKDGGALTLYPRHLGSLDAPSSFDRITLRNNGGTLVAEGETNAGNVADAHESAFLNQNREKIDEYLANFNMRLPKNVPDWSQVTIIRDLDLSAHQSTLQGADGQYRPQVYTDDINEIVGDDRSSHGAYTDWIREGRMAQGIRQHIGLKLR